MIVHVKFPSYNQAIEVGEDMQIGSLFEGYAAYYQGKVLPSTYCISQNNMSITLLPILKGGMQIFIRQLNGKTFAIDLPNGDETTVEQLKKLIFDKESITIESQALYNAGKMMENGLPLKEYSVLAETVIHLVTNTSTIAQKIEETEEPFQVLIKMMSDDQMILELPKRDNTTIDEIKELIKSKNGASKETINLFNMGKAMDDKAKTLKEYGVPNSSVLSVVLKVQ